ncbi:hypothetical protein CPT_Ptah_005 [Stenotrophomonas phage Ptah]|uniref:Uncharacterized protein n=1 Tax=Stenotrophomonas phage Ptah TaxID=2859657 RepID=A0AAE8BHN8_9CAUD|nr:hypothetical protein CPT_Ptah_005 [Stenotrophomonas phage Ptah]
MNETITFDTTEAALLLEALRFCLEVDGLSEEEQAIFDKLDALFG